MTISNKTQLEVGDIRVETVLPYLNNSTGISLRDILLQIDQKLQESYGGLIDWGSKGLFTSRWIKSEGAQAIIYNDNGDSKIGKGRFEITGNGTWEYDEFIPVSSTRGVTGKIHIGSSASCTINVGVSCYNSEKIKIADTRGGAIVSGLTPATFNTYSFFKSSVFGESDSDPDPRSLRTGTRFVRLYIKVENNNGTVFFDESELTTSELDERSIKTPDSIETFDWNLAEFFYSSPYVDTTLDTVLKKFFFKNDLDGRVRTFVIKNNNSKDIDLEFPNAKWQGGVPLITIRPGRTSAFTFLKINGILFASVIEELGYTEELE